MHLAGALQLGVGDFTPQRRAGLAGARKSDQPALAAPMHLQKLLIGDFADLLPDSGVGESLPPIRLKILVVESSQVSIEPTSQVYTVGDRGDRHFPHRQ